MKKTLNVINVALIILFSIGCSSIPQFKTHGEAYRASGMIKTKEIMFIHGMFVTPATWTEWQTYFKNLDYQVSAPAWPLHGGSVQELRQPSRLEKLGELQFAQVLDHYRNLLKAKKQKPILVGHSMGGLIAQILLSEGLAEAAVAIDSAPPNGIIVLKWSFIRSNWGVVSPFASNKEPIQLDIDAFSYAFLNTQASAEVRQKIYDQYYVPESRLVGKGPTTHLAEIDLTKARGPLLLIAGAEDHIIPAKLNYKNFELYKETPAFTEFQNFSGRDHWIIASEGWQEVAKFVELWLIKK